jgi:AcrR family transcriptional regulator
MPRATAVTSRKHPSQERSRKTVDAILTATSRVFVREGYEATTTTRVAEVAGVSIGSLYQYFPSKEALLAALIDRHCDKVLSLVTYNAETLPDAPVEEAVRTLIRGILAMHGVNPQLQAILTQHGPYVGGFKRVRELNAQNQQLALGFLRYRAAELRPKNLELAAFILVRALWAVVSAAILERTFRLDDKELEDELCALVIRFLLP